ncbi:MAG: signal peptidase II [Desulfatirhabdiaceae bacterium]
MRDKLFLLVSGPVIVLDQITKAIILATLPILDSISVIPGFFNIVHVRNPGGAFGFMAGQGPMVRSILFLVISGLAAGVIIWLYRRTPASFRVLRFALTLIFGGAIGNIIDRIRFGEVVDFLDVYINDLHWPAFNVADSAITIGMTIMIYHVLFKKMPE